MSGPKWEAADWAVQNLLAGLTPADSFNLGLFHDTTTWLARSPVRGDERTVRQARDFLLGHTDSGGTELGVALEQALGQPRDAEGRARHVLIVTDAQVSDAGRLLDLVEREAARPDRRRVDVLCIDAAPNSGLAGELAERGGGLARFLTSDPAEDDIATALDDVLADWAAPVLRGLTLEIDQPDVQAPGRRVTPSGSGTCAVDLGDLPAGRAVWVAGRVDRPAPTIGFRLTSPDGQEVAVERQDLFPELAHRPSVAALFGARCVLDLELAASSGIGLERRLRQLGYDPGTLPAEPPIYAENRRARAAEAVRPLLVEEALRYGIACSETAFVATRTEAGEKVAGTVVVGNALPHGWSDDFLMPRMMAAPGGAMRMRMAQPFAPASPAPLAGPPPMPGSMPPTAYDAGPPMAFASVAPVDASPPVRERVVFSAVPAFDGSEAILFDSATSPARLPNDGTLARMVIHFPDGPPAALDPSLTLLLFVDDMMSPRARVRLADLLRLGGERPLNVRRQAGQVVRVVLYDPSGAWARSAPRLEVRLG
jgi:Ca-activated chloride channel family protein